MNVTYIAIALGLLLIIIPLGKYLGEALVDNDHNIIECEDEE